MLIVSKLKLMLKIISGISKKYFSVYVEFVVRKPFFGIIKPNKHNKRLSNDLTVYLFEILKSNVPERNFLHSLIMI